MSRMTDEEVMTALRSDTPLNRARREFSSAWAALEQDGMQRQPSGIIEIRRREFEATQKIAAALSPPVPTEGLRKALEPFAKAAELAETDEADDYSLYSSSARHILTIGHLREARAALRAMPLQDCGWQDISSAPTDGSRILAWHRDWETSHTAQWFGSYWGVFYKTGPFLFQPTHWQPLPAAPALIAEEETK